MRNLLLILTLAAVVLSAGEYEVNLPAGRQGETLCSVELTGDVLANLGGHPAWLRMYDRNGTVIPWAREQMSTPRMAESRVAHAVSLQRVRHKEDGTLEILCGTAENLPARVCLTFHTRMKDFEQQVRIFGIDADGNDALLRGDGFIFESSANLELKNVNVAFEPGKYRRFRILLDSASMERRNALRRVSREWTDKGVSARVSEQQQVTDQAFKIDRLELWSVQVTAAGETPEWLFYPVASLERVQQGASVYLLQPAVYPVSGLEFRFQEENFSRNVTVSHLLAGGEERVLCRGSVRRFRLAGLADECRMEFPPISDGCLKVTIEDHDNPPLHLEQVLVRFPRYRLLCLLQPAMTPCRLTAQPGAEEPVYDTAALLAYGKNTSQAVAAPLSSFSGDPIRPSIPARVSSGFPRPLLFAVIALAVLALGFAIVSTVRKIAP